MKYGYTAQARRDVMHYTYRPLVEVLVSKAAGESKTRRYKALVDSGTEITVMDKSIADVLNIAETDQKGSLAGLENWKEGFFAPVYLKLDDFDEVLNFNVLFIEALGKNFDVILGQADFFRRFDVIFRKRINEFELRIGPTPDEAK